MSNMLKLATTATLLAIIPACSFIARDAEDYRKVTRELVETRGGDIKECYDVLLATNESVTGKVVVNFSVEKKTGKIMNPQIDPATTAPAELGECIIQAIDGLQLDPADAREGQATFAWDFKAAEPKQL